jgi:tRNA A-37 threonylcarbamoyl transferase component Bud32
MKQDLIAQITSRPGYVHLSYGNRYILDTAIRFYQSQPTHDPTYHRLTTQTFMDIANEFLPNVQSHITQQQLFIIDHIRSISLLSPIKFQFIQYLNHGCFGVAFLVLFQCQPVVLKISTNSLYYQNEVDHMRLFYHHNLGVVPIEHFTITYLQTTYYCILMQQLDGTLEDLLLHSSSPITQTEADMIVKQLQDMLHYMSHHKLFHHDLCLSNIGYLKTPSFTLKLIDFGSPYHISEQNHQHGLDRLAMTLTLQEFIIENPTSPNVDIAKYMWNQLQINES